MILVSAGHYPGAKGASFGNFNEHDEAVLWVEEICRHLTHGYKIVPSSPLKGKVAFINGYDATMAVEIHFNSAVDPQGNHIGNGCEVLYCPLAERGYDLAKALSIALSAFFHPNRGAKEGWYQMNPAKGVDRFLRTTHCPAVIVEPEFIHHKTLIQAERVDACKTIAGVLDMFYDRWKGNAAA